MDETLSQWERRARPMPPARAEIDFLHSFSPAEAERLKRGLIPRQMEDKWFGVLRDDSLDFHRSWTGYHIYRLPVRKRPGGGGLDAGPLVVNADPGQYARHADLYERDTARMLIRRMLEEEGA